MRIIHTADVHFDHSFLHDFGPSGHGPARRAAIRSAFRRLIDRCLAWPADALLVAGGLFDADRVTPESLAFLRDCFADLAPIPVVIAPGESDPYGPDSPYARFPWPPNVRIFLAPAWQFFEFDGLTVHGFARTHLAPDGGPDTAGGGGLHIAIAHGVPPAVMEGKGLAYAALGGSREPFSETLACGTPVWAPGPLEALGFDDGPSGAYIEAEIGAGAVSAALCSVSRARYVSGALSAGGADEAAAELLRAIPADAEPVFGRFTASTPDLAALEALAAPRFAWLDLTPADEDGAAEAGLTSGHPVAAEFLGRMVAAAVHAGTDAERRLALRARRLGHLALSGVTPVYGAFRP